MTTTSGRPGLGLAFVPTLSPERLEPLARAVEAAGLDDFVAFLGREVLPRLSDVPGPE